MIPDSEYSTDSSRKVHSNSRSFRKNGWPHASIIKYINEPGVSWHNESRSKGHSE